MTDQEQKESEVNQPAPAPEKKPIGFASMDKEKHLEIAARGGAAAHTRHRWTPEEARRAAYLAAEAKRKKRAEEQAYNDYMQSIQGEIAYAKSKEGDDGSPFDD